MSSLINGTLITLIAMALALLAVLIVLKIKWFVSDWCFENLNKAFNKALMRNRKESK